MHRVNVPTIAATFLTAVLCALPGAEAVAQSGVPSFLGLGKEYSILMAGFTENEDFLDIKVVEIGTDGWFKAHEKDDDAELFWINSNAVAVIVDLQEQAMLEAAAQAEYEASVLLQESMLAATAPLVLRRLMEAQEAYHADHGTYATEGIDSVRPGGALAVHIVAADSTGWNAIAYSRNTGLSQCAVSVGTGPATSSLVPQGQVVCSNR